MTRHQVVIVGAGPTGLMLAGELALAGIDVAIVERRPDQELAGMRAGGLHMRTIEVLDQRGIGERFVAQGQRHPALHFHGAFLDMTDVPTRRNYFVALSQNHIERTLAAWVGERGVPIWRGREVVGFAQDDAGVDVDAADGFRARADYLVGCDGARSVVRKEAGIAFAGWEPTKSWLIAEARWTREPEWGVRHDAYGTHALGRMEQSDQVRIVLSERELTDDRNPTLDEVRRGLVSVYGTDFGIHDSVWMSRFTDRCRQAVAYRDRRVLLAGDAAHIHPPLGGQGLNIGLQDAVNLGWKLAQVVERTSPDELLDSYHAERHPVAARVLRDTMADVALQRPDEQTRALVKIVSELARMDEPRRHIVAARSGLDIRYDLGDGHPLLGRRVPDLAVDTRDGPRRIFDFLHGGRPVLLVFGGSDDRDVTSRIVAGEAFAEIAPWTDRVPVVTAEYAGPWDLPAVGAVASPAAVLVRPDGYVAWVGEGQGPAAKPRPDQNPQRNLGHGLSAVLIEWFGPHGRVVAPMRVGSCDRPSEPPRS
ncbi:hypothetical protein CCR97_19685 [Rhodoplanes elegans]|uniref:FAD-binding domain-containing protein n=1 Tax=Rhodoplanes elegans TaxID=29408 RepID=A0A327KT00_9BRAD|nr:FAD-dependent monooxygenase [Rhodoplanes elegans]MBK5960400.1 hypothetical protein [Rhodoplanes elegans]RAI40773.1 hypothetical protein CH338_05260 [Rhodoplanes elegans]